ncbi:uncharacterized protein LOC129959422 [Argiope bruennichi]|uniref:uncharacterized protein LOC129959422 n=1 Tax=Argiope bruennichi TaxID=94029 RepID=UPI0024945EE0|nr:uncharacterized protein LOC129959422 [Argiope bruennichi]
MLQDYENVFENWKKEGIVEELNSEDLKDSKCHYLPHRPVIKNNSPTRIRSVFDGSAKSKGSPSLNDCLVTGPNLVELIPTLINRFRIGKYGVIADIHKAFLQIQLNDSDKDYLRFLWWQDGDSNNVKIYRHCRVVFGIKSSPFLLGATLNHLLDGAPDCYKMTAQHLQKYMYVDNCVASVKSEADLTQFINESTKIMALGKFDLRGWQHNSFESLIDNCNESQDVSPTSQNVPVLGLLWNIERDTLELLGCCIGLWLAKTICTDLEELGDIPVYYWSDSMNCLYWINNDEQRATFVMNRVKEIRSRSEPYQWNHVPGNLNPADLPSRGCSVNTLIARRWWEGPAWLTEEEELWPVSNLSPDKNVVNAEKKKSVVNSLFVSDYIREFLIRFSSFEKLIRVTAWMIRFCRSSKLAKSCRVTDILTPDELKEAETKILLIVKKTSFVSDHPVVTSLIVSKHKELLHCGIQTLIASLREKYWILKARKTIRKVIRKCVICKRFNARPIEVMFAPLSDDRIKDVSCFEVTGIDLAGPVFLRDGSKSWIVLFTCAVYRTVHLDTVHIRTKQGELLRPIQRLCPLEVSSPFDRELRKRIEDPVICDEGEDIIRVIHHPQCRSLRKNQHQCPSLRKNQHQCPSLRKNQHQCPSLRKNQHQCSSLRKNQHQCSSLRKNQHQCSSLRKNQHQCPSLRKNQHQCSSLRKNQHHSQPPFRRGKDFCH